MIQEVHYYSDGYRLWGELFVPDDLGPGEQRPAVLECPGFRRAAVDKAELPPEFGRPGLVNERLQGAGYIIFAPHLRGFGRSQGREGYTEGKRTRLNPFHQIEDLRNAITYLQTRTDIVAVDSIATFGTSWGGTLAPYLAGVDSRVQVCAGGLGVGDGEEWMRSLRRQWEFRELKERLDADLRQQVITGRPEYVDPLEIMLPDPDAETHYKALAHTGISELQYTLDTAHYIMQFKPIDVATRISCPTIFIAAENDDICSMQGYLDLYRRAPQPKAFVCIEGASHYGAYGPDFIDALADPIVSWLQRWLPAHPGDELPRRPRTIAEPSDEAAQWTRR